MFKQGMKSRAKTIVKSVALMLICLEDPQRFNEALEGLTERHFQMGVKAAECGFPNSFSPPFHHFVFADGIVGECLFWSFRKCLGSAYDFTVHQAWLHIFCSVLRVRENDGSLCFPYLFLSTHTDN
jgi:hypothetical protein